MKVKGKHLSFETIERFIFRAFLLFLFVFHLIKYLKFELSHW